MWSRYLEKAKEMGALRALVISPAAVVTAPWVRHKCQFGCEHYGKSLCCPPRTPTWKETQEILDSFSVAFLIHNTGWNTTEIVRTVSGMLFSAGYYKTIAFGSGPCRLCKKCTLDDCPHRDITIPSMEACGIDVFATARGLGLPIHVLENINDPHNCYGLVLVE